MLSALIPPVGRKPAVPLAGQLAHESCVRPGPLVLGTAFLRFPTAAPDRDRHCCYRGAERLGPEHFCLTLHVAMQIGPYLHPHLSVRVLGVWSLRILESELRWMRRYRPPPFICKAPAASRSKPSSNKCSPLLIARTMRANVANSCCLQLRSGFRSKNGITLSSQQPSPSTNPAMYASSLSC